MTVLDSFVIGENKVYVPCGELESIQGGREAITESPFPWWGPGHSQGPFHRCPGGKGGKTCGIC